MSTARAAGPAEPAGARRADLRIAGPAVAAWLGVLCGITAWPVVGWSVAAACAGVAVAATVLGLRARQPAAGGPWMVRPGTAGRTARLIAVLAVCAGAGCAAAGLRVAAVKGGTVATLTARHDTVRAGLVVTGSVRPLPTCPGPACRPHTLVPARLETIRTGGRTIRVRLPVLVIAGPDATGLGIGRPFRVRGRLEPARSGELLAAVVLARGRVQPAGRPPPARRLAQTVRERLRAAASVLPQPARGLLPALVDGDRTGIPQETSDQFLAAGMTHLLAVSGTNLAILAAAIAGIARLLRRPVLAALSVLPATALFVLVAGPEPSVLRAAVMGVIAATALAAGRERSGMRALSVAVLALVLFDPGLAQSYGFALSTLATGGILLLAPPIRDRLQRRLPRWLAVAVSVPAAAELACAPVVAMMASQVSLVAVPANLVADPLVAPATVLGALAAALAPVAPSVTGVLVWPAGCAVTGIAAVARVAASVPHATIPWPGGLLGAVALLAAVLGAVLLYRRLRRPYRALLIAAALTVLAVAITFKVAVPGAPGRWLLTACDVGQGDGLVLATGDGGAVVVDTGPRPGLMDACLKRLDVSRVPLVVLTHFHADHAGGLSGVLRGRSVGAVATSPYHVPAEEYATVTRELAKRHIPLSTVTPGRRLRIGDLRLTVLGPAAGTARSAATEGDDAGPNDASVVLFAREGPLTVLLTGDIEPPAQDALLSSGVPHARILKVPHHGSGNQDPDFLAAPGEQAAIISVGRDNGYGHPAPRTVHRLRGLGAAVHRTDTEGDIIVAADGHGGLTINTGAHRNTTR